MIEGELNHGTLHGTLRERGPKGEDATINGINTLTLNATNGVELNQTGSTATLEADNTIARKTDLPTKTSDLTNDSTYQTLSDVNSAIAVESQNRQTADSNLQSQIDAITSASDVVDVVGTYAELQAYDTQHLKDNDIIKVLVDETRNNAISYYRWSQTNSSFSYVGSQGPFYTKSEADSLLNNKQDKTDNNLQTTSKSVVGAINEVNTNKVDKIEGKGLSTNDYTNAEKSKLAGIEEGSEVNNVDDVKVNGTSVVDENKVANIDLSDYATKDDLDVVDNKVIDTRNELNRVRDAILETGTASNSNITLNDSVMAELQELGATGKVKQNTTTGKQLFNVHSQIGDDSLSTHGISYTINDDGSITANGTSTESYINISWNIKLPAGTYKFNGCPSGGSSQGYCCMVSIDRGAQQIYEMGNGATFTLDEEKTIWFMPIRIGNSATLNNLTFKPMLVSVDELGDFEQYTGSYYNEDTGNIVLMPSPRPDYEQPISVVEGSFTIKNTGKNFCRLDNANLSGTNYTFKIEDGLVSFNGTSHEGSYDLCGGLRTGQYLPTNFANANDYHLTGKDNGTYTISLTNIEKSKAGSNNTSIVVFTNQRIIYSIFFNQNSSVPISRQITLQEDEYIKSIYMWVNGANATSIFSFNIQLEQSPIATPYVSHQESPITINLGNEFMAEIGNTKDYVELAYNQQDGLYHKLLHKFIGRIVLNGSESVYTHITKDTTTAFVINDSSLKREGKGICNHFRYLYSDSDMEHWYVGGARYIFFINKSRLLSDDNYGFKQWLSTHPTEVYYELAEPYVVDLGTDDMPLSYDKITHIYTDNPLQPVVNVTYYRDFTTTVKNLQINNDTLQNELIDLQERVSALEGNI